MCRFLALCRGIHPYLAKVLAVFFLFSSYVEASPLFNGKVVCLQINPPIEWGLSNVNQTFKIQAGKKSGMGVFPVSAINSYVKTSSSATQNYSDSLSGQARLDVPNGALDGVEKVIIELSGSNRGLLFGADGKPGMWITSYSFVLDQQTMSGTMQGIKRFESTEFNGHNDAKTSIIQDMPIKQVTCSR